MRLRCAGRGAPRPRGALGRGWEKEGGRYGDGDGDGDGVGVRDGVEMGEGDGDGDGVEEGCRVGREGRMTGAPRPAARLMPAERDMAGGAGEERAEWEEGQRCGRGIGS